MEILVTPTGIVRCVYGEAIDLQRLGPLQITRASHVEPRPDGEWQADLAPVAGPVLGPFSCRSAALRAESVWLAEHWLEAAGAAHRLPRQKAPDN